MHKYRFTDSDGSFALDGAENDMGLYFPIAGEQGIKSSVTPNLLGDIKLDQNHFVMEPVSIENLHNNRSGRNFWCYVKGVGAWSATGASAEQQAARYTEHQEPSGVEAGLMWHRAWRHSQAYGLDAAVTSFVPLQHNTEIMQVKLRNTGKHPVTLHSHSGSSDLWTQRRQYPGSPSCHFAVTPHYGIRAWSSCDPHSVL